MAFIVHILVTAALLYLVSRIVPSEPDVGLGRGGAILARGLSLLGDTCVALGLPYLLFGCVSDISQVIQAAWEA